jgi:hypothetical protein
MKELYNVSLKKYEYSRQRGRGGDSEGKLHRLLRSLEELQE